MCDTRYNSESYKRYFLFNFIYNENDIPLWIRMVYSNPYYSEYSKYYLFDNLIKRYITDNDYRLSLQEKEIYFVDGEYFNFLNKEDLIKIRKQDKSIITVIITDNPIILE